MEPIKETVIYTSESKSINRSYKDKKVNIKKSGHPKENKTTVLESNQDKAEISINGKQMLNLKTESLEYLKMIHDTSVIDRKQIQAIKANVLSDYYSKSEIIEIISKKIAGMPNFIKAKI